MILFPDNLTIADFPLVTATLCLEAIDFDFSSYKKISEWYGRFKREYLEIWKIGEIGRDEITGFNQNPPNLNHLNHPIHPPKKV